MIRLLIADDNSLIKDGMTLRLKDCPDIQIAGYASNGIEVLDFLKKDTVDVVLMDIRMPYMDGIDATTRIKEENPNIKVLIITSFADSENIQRAKQSRCNGFISKESNNEDFISVIKSVNNGYDVWTSGLLNTDYNLVVNNQVIDDHALNMLEEKEVVLIKHRVACLKYAEIARKMNYSEAYVRQLAVKIKEKLDLKNVNEIAVWGSKRGL